MNQPLNTEQEILSALRQEADKKYRRKMGILARRLHWSRAKLSKILSGEQAARLPELISICTVLALPLSAILKTTGV